MKSIPIGKNANGTPLYITPKMRRSTHMHVIGGSGTGKSKFLEWIIRKDIREGHGLCLIDWHGTLYKSIVRYCAHLGVGLDNDFRKLILINPSEPDYVTGFNPFVNQGVDVSVQVRRRIEATIRPWGITDTNQMPTFENVMTALYTFAVEQRETLPNAAQLLEYDRPELREYAANVVQAREGKRQLRRLVQTKTFRDWRDFVLSTENRLGRFLGSTTVRRFMGLTEGNLDLLEAMNEGKIVLVNLGSSGYLDRESARVFASLFLNEFFESAMLRAQQMPRGESPEPFNLYLDEFQEYITEDIGSMLDEVRKGGLHMILAHQHLGHLADNPRLLESILVNARIRAVFGGLSYTDACLLANEMFLPDLNTRQIKKAYYHTIHLYDEERRVITSRSRGEGTSEASNWSEGKSTGTSFGSGYSSSAGSISGSGASSGMSMSGPAPAAGPTAQEGWFSESQGANDFLAQSSTQGYSDFSSETYTETSSVGGSTGSSTFASAGESVVPVWVPIPVQELGSEAEWGREEKVSKVAEMLKAQQQRHCFIKLDTELTQPLQIPFVRDYSLSDENLLEYEKEVYNTQGALPAHEVDRLLVANEERFLTSTYKVIDVTPTLERPALEAKPVTKRTTKAKPNIFESINDDDPIGRE